MNTLRLLAVVAMLVSACSPDGLEGAQEYDDAPANVDVAASCTPSGPDEPTVPINALWAVHVLDRIGCEGVPMPTRLQFSEMSDGRKVAFLVFSNGYSDETEWGELESGKIWVEDFPLRPDLSMEVSIWVWGSSRTLHSQIHYYGSTACEVSVFATLE